jgi:lycopene cyclase domain-containing protein
MNFEYLTILIFFFLTGLFIEWKYKIHLYHSRKERIVATLVMFVIGAAWDNFSTWRGHWMFPVEGTIGIKIGFIPIEEYFFILIVPFWVLTVYKLVLKKVK